MVESMTLLMGATLVDGEETATISSNYLQARCLVTSGTESMSFDAGETVHHYVPFGSTVTLFPFSPP